MNALTIILLVYVALDIITGIILYAVLRKNGWSRYELAVNFRNLIRKSRRAFINEW